MSFSMDGCYAVGASSVFLIGTQNASAAASLKTQPVFLVDNPT